MIKHPPRPRYRFCWSCNRQLNGNQHRVALTPGDGREVIVHASCAKRDGLVLRLGAPAYEAEKVAEVKP